MRFSSLLFLFIFLCACTTPESDFTNNFVRPIYDTRVNVEPINREERIRFTQIENERFRILVTPLREFMNKALDERSTFVGEIEREFPRCKIQRYCQSEVSVGGIKKFERYNELTAKVHRFDYQIVDIERKIRDLERAHDIQLRLIYNRYLVRQILDLSKQEAVFDTVIVHSLENYPVRLSLSKQILALVMNLPGIQSTDFDFSIYGKPIDEAAILLTLDVWRGPTMGEKPSRFLTTLLVNAQELDTQAYEDNFSRAWTDIFTEPRFDRLKKEVFCNLYGIASYSLAAKMVLLKKSVCTERRASMRVPRNKFEYNFTPTDWVLPLTFYEVKSPKDDSN